MRQHFQRGSAHTSGIVHGRRVQVSTLNPISGTCSACGSEGQLTHRVVIDDNPGTVCTACASLALADMGATLTHHTGTTTTVAGSTHVNHVHGDVINLGDLNLNDLLRDVFGTTEGDQS